MNIIQISFFVLEQQLVAMDAARSWCFLLLCTKTTLARVSGKMTLLPTEFKCFTSWLVNSESGSIETALPPFFVAYISQYCPCITFSSLYFTHSLLEGAISRQPSKKETTKQFALTAIFSM